MQFSNTVKGGAVIATSPYLTYGRFDLAGRAPLLRVLTIFGAFLILAARMPHLFLEPQFWAEDGYVFHDA